MCIRENDKKPETNTHYKVFVEKEGKLYWLLRNKEGQTSLGRDKIENANEKLESTEIGFHCWELKKDAELFIESIKSVLSWKKLLETENSKMVVRKVKCEEHLKSGLAKCGFKFQNNAHFSQMCNDNVYKFKQAYAYKYMTIMEG